MRSEAVPFVAREAELARFGQLLADDRLVTLTGAGGVGKTRLAREAVRRRNEQEPIETYVVELARLATGDLVPAALLDGLAARQEPGRDPIETIASRLRGGPARLVLDNCEHVAGKVGDVLAKLLADCPELIVLVTARQPLGLDGETVFQLPPMSVPRADEPSPLVALVDSDAGRLFIACAALRAPGFVLSAEAASPITRICRELDGVPLAITLAASRIAEQPPEEIAEGLTDRLRLSSDSGGRAGSLVPAHQRSLRASMDWSHHLLDFGEQAMFRRFAVLSAATLADVAAICSPEDDTAVIAARLQRLVTLGLVQRTADAMLGDYYEMSGTVREYALELLAREGEQETVQDRHMRRFRALVAEANGLLNHAAGRKALELHLPDMRAALDRAMSRDLPSALAMCERLAHYWFVADQFEEGRATCARVLALADDADPAPRALVFWSAALLAAVVEDYAEAHALATQGRALAEVADDERAIGLCLQITNFALGTVDPAAAADSGRHAVELLRRTGDGHDLGHALMTLACVEALRDEFDVFDALRAEFMSIPEARADAWLRILVDLHAAWAQLVRGDPRSAIEQAERVLEMVDGETSMRAGLARSHRLHAMARAGDADRALSEGTAELQAANVAGSEVAVLALEQAIAVAELAAGDLDSAQRRADRFLAAPALHSAALWREIVARIAVERGAPDLVAAHARCIREIGQRSGSARQLALADYLDGLAALQHGELVAAAERLHSALASQQRHGCRRDAVDTLEALGHLAVRGGEETRGARLHAASAAGRRALGLVAVPPDGRDLAAMRLVIDATLGGDAAAQARAEGERLSLHEAINYAQRARGRRDRPPAGWDSLTPTEAETARLAASGLSNPDIATRMFIARGTVKSHLSRAYEKLGVTGRTQLMLLLHGADTHAADGAAERSRSERSGQVADVLGAPRG
jgi:predicted ATPase/DNA-binding CsgD family transcriptional regulator